MNHQANHITNHKKNLQLQRGRLGLLTLALALALGLGGCSRTVEPPDREAAPRPAAPRPAEQVAPGEVQWSIVYELDLLAHRADAQIAHDAGVDDLRDTAFRLYETGRILAGDLPPANVKNPAQVRTLQDDLGNLVEALETRDTMDQEELRTVLAAFHPLVLRLMEAAGLPHKHDHVHDEAHDEAHDEEHDEDDDADHSDHDHD